MGREMGRRTDRECSIGGMQHWTDAAMDRWVQTCKSPHMTLEKLCTKASHFNLVTFFSLGRVGQGRANQNSCFFVLATLKWPSVLLTFYHSFFVLYILKYDVSIFYIMCQQYNNSPSKWLQNMIIVYDIKT